MKRFLSPIPGCLTTLCTGALLLSGLGWATPAVADAPMFVDAPGDLRNDPAKVSTQDLSVQFDSLEDAQAAAQEQGATFVHLPHISAFKGVTCGYFEYNESAEDSRAVLARKDAVRSARGLRSVEYVFQTVLPITTQTQAPLEPSLFEDALDASANERDGSRVVPNDPKYNRLWGMKKISAAKAWDVHTDASNIVLFLTDSGINLKNSDIKENLWTNSQEIPGNGKDDDNNGYVDDVHGIDAANGSGNPQDRIGHGSHCACTIAGHGDNNFGVVGVAWKLQIAACKAFKDDGTGKSSWQTKCFEYMIDLKKRGEKITVTSNSWGSKGDDPNVKASFEAASALGMIHAVAAGNNGDNNDSPSKAMYPASYDLESIISVIWTGPNDARNRSSNYGRKTTDLAAPGTDILSCEGTKNGHYESSGTSMATPHVGGALALMSSYARKADMATLRKALLDNVDKVSSLGSACATGGRLNVAKALAALEPSEEEEEGSTEGEETATAGEESTTGDSTETDGDDSGESEGDETGDTTETEGDDPGTEESKTPDQTPDESKTPDESPKTPKETPEPSKTPEPSTTPEDSNEDTEAGEDSEDNEDSDKPATETQDEGGCGGCDSTGAPSSPALGGLFILGLGLLLRRRGA